MLRALLAVLFPIALAAQAPAFDVASVKPTQHGRDARGFSHSSSGIPHSGLYTAENESLQGLIQFAYSVKAYQISGPDWLHDDSECFDVEAKAPHGTSDAEMRRMMQTLLAERFKLAVQHQSRILPIYELVVGKQGPKLRASESPAGNSSFHSTGGHVTATGASMADFANQLSLWVARPVMDKTGLSGSFDFKLQYDPQDSGDGPSIFGALQGQLGLRLVGAKGPVETLVVDHVEKMPAAN